MTTGHAELVAAIASEIAVSGPIPFVRFMELALYHPQFGYYTRSPETGTERIGWTGDFYTSSDVHPTLGHALARQATQIDRLLGQPDPFIVVEMGPGKGLLAKHFLSACRTESRSLFERLRYILIDRSPAMRESQRRNLAQWLSRPGLVSWTDDLDELAPSSITGMFLSNELLDAFPTHRIQITGGRVEELWVDRQDGRFVECLRPPSTAALAQYAQGLAAHWPDGYRTEINLNALDWIRHVARSLKRGVVLTIDYGHTAQDLYRSDRKNGTFLCYFKQSAHEDPFTHVGEQDMTAHVDFSSLATAGEEHGLQVTGFTNQMSFLMGLGVEQLIASLEPESPEFRAAIHLLKPTGMGGTFKVLAQHKGIEQPQLEGLKFKPFFNDALAATGDRIPCHSSTANQAFAAPGA